MGKHIQKFLLFFVILFIVMTPIYGCGMNQKQTDNKDEESTLDAVYSGENLVPGDIKGSITDVIVQHGRVGIVTGEWIDSAFKKRKVHVYVMNIDQSDFQEIPLTIAEGEHLEQYTFDNNGNFIYTVSSLEGDTYEGELIKVDGNGKELIRESIHLEEKVICGFLVDEEDNVFFAQPESVSVFDKDFKHVGTLQRNAEKNYIDSVAFDKNGQVICSQQYDDGEESFLLVREIGESFDEWKNSYSIPVNNNPVDGNILMNGWGEYDFCYKEADGIYGYITKKKKSVKLLDFLASNMTGNHTEKLTLLKDNKWIGIVYDEAADSKVMVYNKVDPEIVANRKKVVVGVFGIEEDIEKAIIQFNGEHPQYQIEVRDYLESEDPILQMNTEVITGNAPDIIDLSYISMNQYVEKGLLENLAPYIEEDSEICMQDFIPSVSETIMEGNNLYFVAPSFSLYSLAAPKKVVGEKDSWTLEELKEILKKKDEDVNAFYRNDKMDILYALLEMHVYDFVDWKTGNCDFESEEFKELLVLIDRIGIDGAATSSEELSEENDAIQENKVLFWEGCVDLFQLYMNKRTFGEEITYIGYPNKDREGCYFRFNYSFAICSKSKEKKVAWDFVRIFMTKDYQGKMGLYSSNMPTRQDCFDLMLEANIATEAYTNEMGQDIIPGEIWTAYSYIYNDPSLKENPLTEEDIDELRELVQKTKRYVSYEDALMDIIEEEAARYFAGEKSLEDTVRIIQNRAEIYVNENR